MSIVTMLASTSKFVADCASATARVISTSLKATATDRLTCGRTAIAAVTIGKLTEASTVVSVCTFGASERIVIWSSG